MSYFKSYSRVRTATPFEMAALNPQPLPPGGSWVMLNPQPLPPRYLQAGIIIVGG